jgi:transposase
MAMELSQEKKTQIAACHGKGMTLSEISARSGLVEDVVAEFLESIGKTPNRSERRKITRLTQEQKKRIGELFSQGKGCTEISKSTGINIKTIEYYKKKFRKEKEPESAATDTSSGCIKKTDGDTVSISKDNTIEAKCQVLAKALKFAHKGILAQYEEMSHECQLAFDLGQLFAEIEQRMKEGGVEVE